MADRTSAEVFGKIFELLARNPSKEIIALAEEIMEISEDYDFNEYQMDCDEALETLGVKSPDEFEED